MPGRANDRAAGRTIKPRARMRRGSTRGNHGEILWQPQSGGHRRRRAGAGDHDRARRRIVRRHRGLHQDDLCLAARVLWRDVDRAAVLPELCPGADDAQDPGRTEGRDHRTHRTQRAVVFPLWRADDRGHRPDRGLERRVPGAGAAVPGWWQGPPDRPWHVDGADHGVQRVVHHLARAEEDPGPGRGDRRGKGRGRSARALRQPHQHAAVDRHALQHVGRQRAGCLHRFSGCAGAHPETSIPPAPHSGPVRTAFRRTGNRSRSACPDGRPAPAGSAGSAPTAGPPAPPRPR